MKYDLLSVTDGTKKRSDGTPMRTIGHFLRNCPTAVISQYGVWRVNGTVVTLYDTLGPEALATIVSEAELKTVVCTPASGMMLLRCLDTDPERFSFIKNLIIDGTISEELMSMGERYQVRLYCFEELVKEGASLPEVETSLLTPEDMCMICYTSGTTGVPKGALLTHGNMIAVSTAVVQYIDTIGGLTNEDIHMSYLPMAHVFEHFVQSAIVYYGARIGFYQGDTTKLVDDILHLRPTIFPSVPRLLNRITDSIFAKVRKQSGIVQMLFNKGFETKKYNLLHENRLDHPVYDKLVFKKICSVIGLDRLKFIVTGSAPITDDCLIALRVIMGCPVIQGLGLTETGGGICCSYFQDNCTVGHCGGIICCGEARLVSVPEMGYSITDTYHGREVAADGTVIQPGIECRGRGEACFRGCNIIQGYYKRPEINKVVFDSEGWFHSGDIAITDT